MKNKIVQLLIALAAVAVLMATLTLGASAETADGSAADTFTVNGVEIPKFEFPDKPYLNAEDVGLPLAEIREAFNILPEFKYEDGKYMVSDIGADTVNIYNNRDYEYIKMTLEDGYWVAEIPEADFRDPELRWDVFFESEANNWQFYYHGEDPDRRVQFSVDGNVYSIGIYIDPSEDWLDVSYPVMDRQCYDDYRDGKLVEHEVTLYFDDQVDWFSVAYNTDKTVNHVKLWYDADSTYYYLLPESGWYNVPFADPLYKKPTPAGYEDKDIAYFAGQAPCVINCAHEGKVPASCDEPEFCPVCGLVSEGSEPLGHDMVTDEAKDPTCTETGLTIGSHCSRCDSATTPQVEVPALGHDMVTDSGKAPTCSESGLTEGSHCTRCDGVTVPQEEIPALGHEWADATYETPKTCTVCGETEGDPLERAEGTTDTVTDTEEDSNQNGTSENGASHDGTSDEGCASTVAFGVVALVSVLGAALTLKKKE